MTDNGPAGHPFSSDEDLCHYVESELGRTIRADRPKLYVEFKPPEYSGVADSHLLRWAISSPHMDRSEHLLDRHYLLEARLVEGEFVIWFGKLSGFPLGGGTTRDAILPAVHVPLHASTSDRLTASVRYCCGCWSTRLRPALCGIRWSTQ